MSEYRKTSRGAKGVQTIKFTEKRGGLAAALVVRPHQELVFISQEGMVQRTGVRGIRQTGRSSQGVTLMNVRDDDRVSAVALVVESEASTAAAVAEAATNVRRPWTAPAARGRLEPEADASPRSTTSSRSRTAPGTTERAERRWGLLLSDHQRKEVVRIGSSSSCGTLEVTGR